jgi:hypothetical protein
LNSLQPRILHSKFDGLWLPGSRKEDFYKYSVYFYYYLGQRAIRKSPGELKMYNDNPTEHCEGI